MSVHHNKFTRREATMTAATTLAINTAATPRAPLRVDREKHLLSLHRRWGDLMREYYRSVDGNMDDERQAAMEPEVQRVESWLIRAIEAAPSTDHVATKVLFDIVLEQGNFAGTDTSYYIDDEGKFITAASDDRCPYFSLLMRRLAAAAPSVEFHTVRRLVDERRATA